MEPPVDPNPPELRLVGVDNDEMVTPPDTDLLREPGEAISEPISPPCPELQSFPNTAPSSDSACNSLSPQSIVEAILFATDTPLSAAKITEILGQQTPREVRTFIDALNTQYQQEGRSFRIEEIAGGYQMLTLPAYNDYLSKLFSFRQESKLSPAALETLAIVAYKQPVLRADIEAVRGVQCGEILNRLRELNLIRIVGRAEDVGRPILYGTTKKFLETFGLSSLDDLPKVEELIPPSASS